MSSQLLVLLIHSPCLALDDDKLEPPMGILMIASVLQQEGITTRVLDLSGHTLSESYNIVEELTEEPTIVGFSTFSVSYNYTLRIVRKIKRLIPKVFTIAGGPHASALPEESIKTFDLVLAGEGEKAISKIRRVKQEQIDDVYWKRTLQTLKN